MVDLLSAERADREQRLDLTFTVAPIVTGLLVSTATRVFRPPLPYTVFSRTPSWLSAGVVAGLRPSTARVRDGAHSLRVTPLCSFANIRRNSISTVDLSHKGGFVRL